MSIPVNSKVSAVAKSMTLALGARATAMRAEGIDVVSFAAGEPDFETPEVIKRRAKADITDGVTRYTPVVGTPALRAAICAKLKRDNDLEYTPEQIIVSCGGKHTLYNIFQTLLEEGDEVIVPAPYWLSYPEQIKLGGGKCVEVSASAASGYKITPEQLEAAITDRTKAFLINSPCNPTGAAYSPDEIRAMAAVMEKHPKITIISDEIYERMTYGGTEHLSFAAAAPGMAERTLTVNGMSKTYAMTGWRIGYCAGPADFIAAMGRLQGHMTSNATAFCQSASIAGLEHAEEDVQKMKAAFDERRGLILGRLREIEGIECPEPHGAFYVFPDISALYEKAGVDGSIAFCEKLLDEKHVVAVPGKPFGDDRSMRLSYATSNEQINEGMDRLAEFVAGFG